jgi:hypothetical protein
VNEDSSECMSRSANSLEQCVAATGHVTGQCAWQSADNSIHACDCQGRFNSTNYVSWGRSGCKHLPEDSNSRDRAKTLEDITSVFKHQYHLNGTMKSSQQCVSIRSAQVQNKFD